MLTLEQKKKIEEMLVQGASQKEIAEKLNISQSTVYRYAKELEKKKKEQPKTEEQKQEKQEKQEKQQQEQEPEAKISEETRKTINENAERTGFQDPCSQIQAHLRSEGHNVWGTVENSPEMAWAFLGVHDIRLS